MVLVTRRREKEREKERPLEMCEARVELIFMYLASSIALYLR